MKIKNWLREDMLARVSRINKSVGLDDKLGDRRPTQLSEGQKQRVAIGRSLMVAPRALLLDEPMSNLDPPSRVKIRGELRKLHDEYGMTTVMVTHNITDAMAVADRMVVMNDAVIIQVGDPREIYERPANAFVADFIRCYDIAKALRHTL